MTRPVTRWLSRRTHSPEEDIDFRASLAGGPQEAVGETVYAVIHSAQDELVIQDINLCGEETRSPQTLHVRVTHPFPAGPKLQAKLTSQRSNESSVVDSPSGRPPSDRHVTPHVLPALAPSLFLLITCQTDCERHGSPGQVGLPRRQMRTARLRCSFSKPRPPIPSSP